MLRTSRQPIREKKRQGEAWLSVDCSKAKQQERYVIEKQMTLLSEAINNLDIEQFLRPFMRNAHFQNEIVPMLRTKIERLMQLKLFQHHKNSMVMMPSTRRSNEPRYKASQNSEENLRKDRTTLKRPVHRNNSDLSITDSSKSLTND